MNPIANGVYDVQSRQRREFWEDGACWLYVKAPTIARIIKRRNAGLSDRIALPFGHFPDLPGIKGIYAEALTTGIGMYRLWLDVETARFEKIEIEEFMLPVEYRKCLCGAPARFLPDGELFIPCGH